jgi:hypothetical protein
MSSVLINQEALREQYPSLSVGCFIKKKPIAMEKRVKAIRVDNQKSMVEISAYLPSLLYLP